MKIHYTLESVREVISATSAIRSQDDPPLPILTGVLEASRAEGKHSVVLVGDPNYRFEMPFKEFVIQTCEIAGIKLMAHDCIPA